MKKYLLIFTFTLVFILTGCFNPVFYEVRKDVPPEEGTVQGPITSITRYTVSGREYLVTSANNGLQYKLANSANHGEWKRFSLENLPFSLHHYDYATYTHEGQQIIKVLADKDTLYIVSAAYEDDDSYGTVSPHTISVYGTKITQASEDGTWIEPSSEGWKCIITDSDNTYFPIYSKSEYYYSAFCIFQTNTPLRENRHVYIRTGNPDADESDYQSVKYYELSDLNAPAEISISVFDSDVSCAKSAIVFNGEILFFNSNAVTTNETYSTEATRFYYADDSILYYNTAPSEKAVAEAVDAESPISALAYCTDAILIGCADYDSISTVSSGGGIYKTNLVSDIPGNTLNDFSTNAKFQIPSNYFITTLINATPERSELDSYLYASTVIFGSEASSSSSYDNVGLWSYYPDRGNWNRE